MRGLSLLLPGQCCRDAPARCCQTPGTGAALGGSSAPRGAGGHAREPGQRDGGDSHAEGRPVWTKLVSPQRTAGKCGSVTVRRPRRAALLSRTSTWWRTPCTRRTWRRTSSPSAPRPHVRAFQCGRGCGGRKAPLGDLRPSRRAPGRDDRRRRSLGTVGAGLSLHLLWLHVPRKSCAV